MAIPFASPTESTILEIVQEAAEDLKQSAPTTLNSTSREVRTWVKSANSAGRAIRRRFVWPDLNRRQLITTIAGTYKYDIPPDFDSQVFDTFWQSSAYRKLFGPCTPAEWEARKSGNIVSSLPMQFRVTRSDAGVRQLELMADPGTGETIYFQYQSSNWLIPAATWAEGTTYTAGEYIHYNGTVYRAGSGGLPGPTPVEAVDYTMSDGVIDWTAVRYEKVVEDGAVPLLDRDLLILGIQVEWLAKNGFDFAKKEAAFTTELNKRIGALSGAQVFSIAGSDSNGFFGWESVPQTGWEG